MKDQIFNFKIFWESYLLSGREKSNDKVLCFGYTNFKAKNVVDATKEWKRLFPNDKIVKVV